MIWITQLLAFFRKNRRYEPNDRLCIAVSVFRVMILISRILLFISIYYYFYISFFISISHNYYYSLSLSLKGFRFESLRCVNTHDNIYYWLLISLFKILFETESEISLIILWKYLLKILGERDYQWIKKKNTHLTLQRRKLFGAQERYLFPKECLFKSFLKSLTSITFISIEILFKTFKERKLLNRIKSDI